jgi:hypothetical protein
MYNTADSIPRADISTVLMEAMGQEGLYIGQLLLPIYTSPTEVGRYPKFPKKEGELLRTGRNASAASTFNSSTKRGATGTYNEIDRRFTWDSYQTEEYGLEERVDDVVGRRMANFFDAEVVTGKLLMNALMMDYEMEVAATINNSSTFTATAADTAYTEANISTANVPKDINACIERMTLLGEVPDTLTLSLTVWNYIRRTQKLQAYLYGYLNVTQGGSNITEQMFAQAFGLQRVLISKKSVDVAAKGLTSSLIPIWGNTYMSLAKTGDGDFMNGGVGRTIVWDADSPGGLFTSETYRDEKRRGTMLRVRSNRAQKVLLTDACQLITTNYA